MANPTATQSPSRGRRIAVAFEVAVALLAFGWILSNANVRALFATCVYALYDGARSSVLLALVDPATIVTALGAVARVVLQIAPLARMLVMSPRHRLAWVPLGSLVWVGIYGISVPAIFSVLTWAILVLASAAAWIAAPRPALRILAFLPWIVSLEPMLGHSPLSDSFWSPERLAPRCAENDGIRPGDLRPDVLVARHYSITPAPSGWLLLGGDRGTFWARRSPEGAITLGPRLLLEPERPLEGNFWQGCVRDGVAWVTSRAYGLCEIRVPTDTGELPTPVCHEAPGAPNIGVELDYVDALCPADRSTVYTSQLVRGGYLELEPSTGATTWHRVIPGMNLQMVMRKDGRILAITTGRFVVFDPASDRVLEEHPAGTVAMGIDVCNTDDSVVITDFTGRVRLFERDPGGKYRFSAATFVAAPRRVAFSPNCKSIAVTSGDDRRVFLMRRQNLEAIRSYSLGPGLRDIVFLDDRWIAAADACTVNVLDGAIPGCEPGSEGGALSPR